MKIVRLVNRTYSGTQKQNSSYRSECL